jgi:transaldolase
MRPKGLKTKIFLDGGDPDEAREIIKIMGFLDGQTTNPTLISKNPNVSERLKKGKKFSEGEIINFYHTVVKEISSIIPQGSISIEVYAVTTTKADQMLKQGREMFSWIPNAHIKFPLSKEGLKAAEQAVREKMRINMTLCFRQEQAAAVYAATQGAKKGNVFISPFIGRLDDRGENGMDIISNIIKMYEKGDGHVMVLTASVRKIDHLLCALKFGSDIVTVPFKVLKEWAEMGLPVPGGDYKYNSKDFKSIPYKDIVLTKNWHEYDISHDLTVKGMENFSSDWDSLIRKM